MASVIELARERECDLAFMWLRDAEFCGRIYDRDGKRPTFIGLFATIV